MAFRFRLAAGLAACLASAAFAQCEPVPLQAPAGYFQGASPEAVTKLNRVYERIAAVAGLRPELVLCMDTRPNAFARDARGQLVLGVTTGMVQMAFAEDELAAVLAHEFGHFQMRHADVKRQAAMDSLRGAIARARTDLRRGASLDDAVKRAATGFNDEVASFSRAAEREADDDGFRLMMKAGYKASGPRELMERMSTRLGTGQKGYFASHPGLGERAQYSKVLEENERYRADAERLAIKRDRANLEALVQAWTRAIPESGAAYYYRAVLLRWSGRTGAEVSAALEESVLRFDGDGLSKLAQGYQAEGDQALLTYCTLLYFEGRTVQSLHCLETLPASDVEVFKKVTGWSSFILTTKRPRDTVARSIHVGQGRTGDTVLSNCSQTIHENGLRIARSWTAARAGESAPEASPYLRCDPGGCNCVPVKDEATLKALQAAIPR